MAGIYGTLMDNDINKTPLYKKFYNYSFKNTVQSEVNYKSFRFGRSVLDKFKKDRFFCEDDSFLICFEGINYSEIMGSSAFIKAYKQKGINFVKDIKGVFSGFFLSKEENKLFVFNDHLSTKNIYFYHSENGLAFSSEMHVLSNHLRENKVSLSYDYDGIYSLALYGQMFDDFTVVKEIKKMDYGSILSYDLSTKKLEKEQYHTFKKEIVSQKLPDVIENINDLMENAIKMEWQKDRDNGYQKHFALISGGMDSRVNTLIAKELGFTNINGYTYGDPNSSDVKIAQKIAYENFDSHLQYNLNDGDFFVENIMENYIKPTDGLIHFTANAIIYQAFSKINTDHYGTLHSGQIGDAVLNSFLKPNYNFEKNVDKIGLTGFVNNKKLLRKINCLDELISRYQNADYELYTYEQRIVNGALEGDRVFSNFLDHVSPFYDKDLLNYIFTVPIGFRSNQKLYFNWLKEKHPQIQEYKWEKIGLKPNSSFNLNYGGLIKKYINGGKKYFGLKYDSMNPIGVWFAENPRPLLAFDAIFDSLIIQVKDSELQKDLKEIYENDIFAYRNKFGVITVLLSLKLHFG